MDGSVKPGSKFSEKTEPSEEELRKIVNTIPSLMWCTLPDGSHDFHNQEWKDYTGLSAEESLGWGWKSTIHPEDIGRLMKKRQEILDQGIAGEVEARVRRFDGVYRWFLFRVEPLRDHEGRVVKWCGTATDIDDRKRVESLLEAEKRTLELIAGGACVSDVLTNLCLAVDAHMPDAATTVLLMDPDGTRLWPVAGPKVPAEWTAAISPRPIGPCDGSCGVAAFSKQRVIVSNVADDPRWPDDCRAIALSNGIRASWSEPLLSRDGQVLGTFAIYYPEPRVPENDDLQLIEAAGNIARIAIERERSRTALDQALDAIAKSEAQLRKIIDTIPTLAWRCLPDGRIDYLNQRWLDFTGLSLEQARGWGWKVIVHPEDVDRITKRWLPDVLSTGRPGEIEARLRRFDGEYRWFLTRIAPFRDETGTVVQWYGTNTDIEDRKQSEEKVRAEGLRDRQTINAICQMIVVLAPNGRALYANQPVLDYTGLTLEEIQAPDFRTRVFHPEDIEAVREPRALGLAGTVPFQLEQRGLGKDGRYRWFFLQYNPLLDDRGNVIRWYTNATDIDDRKKAEERTRGENVALREEVDRASMFEEIVGSSEPLRRVLTHVAKVAPSDSTVLIFGETGTGKELIARAIYKRSKRASKAFVRVNCAAIPASLIASELFGHEKGAFTGATQRRLGRFELADGGTIFLDEVGELPMETQITLLRVLQEREFERVGSGHPTSVDVRVIAATNRDLKAAVTAGLFRQDLFYRLNVFPIQMPALRERANDIPLLVEYLIERYSKKAGKRIRNIARMTLELFQQYDWPGNIRELQNVIERAVILCEGDTFSVEESWLKKEAPNPSLPSVQLAADPVEREREIIEKALAECRGRVSGPDGAAAKLGMPRQTLDSRITILRIDKYRFRAR